MVVKNCSGQLLSARSLRILGKYAALRRRLPSKAQQRGNVIFDLHPSFHFELLVGDVEIETLEVHNGAEFSGVSF